MARRIYAANERTTGFGRMQLAIAAARIGDRELFGHCLFDLVGADFEYPSLMTSHDMGLNKSAFCTDNALSIHGVINEALVYSDSRSIRLLPCSIWAVSSTHLDVYKRQGYVLADHVFLRHRRPG